MECDRRVCDGLFYRLVITLDRGDQAARVFRERCESDHENGRDPDHDLIQPPESGPWGHAGVVRRARGGGPVDQVKAQSQKHPGEGQEDEAIPLEPGGDAAGRRPEQDQ